MTIIFICLAGAWLFGVACFALGCVLGHGVGEREIARLRAEIEDIRVSVLSFGIPDDDIDQTWGR